jgi:hypothetical protein
MHECISKQREKLEMNFRLTRRRLLVTGITSALFAVAAWAEQGQVIHFATPSSVTAGQTVAAQVQVNVAPMAVTFTSNPPGLVNYTVMVNSTNQGVSIPTNAAASAGSYVLVATPAGGGVSKSQSALVYSSGNN